METISSPLSEGIRKLRNQIYVLSAIFGILAVAAGAAGKLTTDLLIVLILIYGIALYAAYYEDERKQQRAILRNTPKLVEPESKILSYSVLHPSSFPSPLESRIDNLAQYFHFNLTFKVKNTTDGNLSLTVHATSPTQAIAFMHDVDRIQWYRRYGVIPSRRKTNVWLNHASSTTVGPRSEEELKLHAIYRKEYAYRMALSYQDVPILYRLTARNGTNFDSGVKRIEVPIAGESKEKKTTPEPMG